MTQEVINYILKVDIQSLKLSYPFTESKIAIYDSTGETHNFTLDELEVLQKRLINNEQFHGDVESLLKG